MSSPTWRKVTKTDPCAVCGKVDWCKVSSDGSVALCGRIDRGSFQKAKGNGGWLHRLIDTPKAQADGLHLRQPQRKANAAPAKLHRDAQAAIDAAGRQCDGTFVAGWTYHDRDGREAFRVIRYTMPDGDKQFRPIRPSKGGWKIGDPSGLLPLYRLPELATASTIYICEGEKAADAAVRIGLTATTSAHGSAAAEKSDWTPLAGRLVVILPDADEPGRKYARDVAKLLLKLDPPATVKILELPELPEGGDIVEYLAAGGTREDVERLAAAVPMIDAADLIGGPVLTCLADVEPSEIRWLWPGRIALGRLTLLVGRPGEGKSFLTTDAAAKVTTGTPWPDGTQCPKGSVIFVCAEDDPADTIRPRLDAHHADCRKVHLLSAVRRIDAEGKRHEVLFTLTDAAALEVALKQHRDCRLIVVDPIGSFLGGATDSHRDNEVRSVLTPVARLAEKYGAAVLVVAHRRKSSGSVADDLAMGSRAFTGIARAVWHLTRDEGDKARRLLLPGKNNLAREGNGLAFTIRGDPPAIVWERDPVAMSADDALAAENDGGNDKPGPEPAARKAAADWLRTILADGEVEAANVKAEAKAAGMGWRTVQRAADELVVIREKNGFSGGWQWRLPKPGSEDANGRCHVPTEQGNLASWHLREIASETANSACHVPEDAKSPDLGTINANGDGRERGDV